MKVSNLNQVFPFILSLFDTLVNFFYLNNKLKKQFIEAFVEAQEESAEILGKEKADRLMQEYLWEKKKRAILTYEIGDLKIKNKAETSLERAKKFNQEIRRILPGDL